MNSNESDKRSDSRREERRVSDDAHNRSSRYSRFGQRSDPAPSLLDLPVNADNLRSLKAAGRSRGIDNLTPSEAARLVPRPSKDDVEFETPIPVSRTARAAEDENGPAVQLFAILSEKDVDAEAAWAYFHEHYIEPGKENAALKGPSQKERAIIREQLLFKKLLRTVASQWVPGDESLPAPAEMVKTMHEYGIMGQGWYLLEILEMLYRALRLRASNDDGQENAEEKRVIVEEQLLSLWSQFFRNCPSEWITKGKQLKLQPVEGTHIDWNGLPDMEELNFSKKMGGDAYRFPFRVHRMFSGVPKASVQHLAVAALFTLDYFASQYCHPYATQNERIPYEPFMRLMLKTLHSAQDTELVSSLGVALLQDNDVPEELVAKIQKRTVHIKHRAVLAATIGDLQVLGSDSIRLTEEQDNALVGYFHGRIKRQIERHNRGVIDQLWQQALLAYGSMQSDNPSESTNMIPPKIYSAFLFGYRDLQEPERQTEIWNHMLASGMTPTHEQWGLMISARMKHLNSMEHIWERMNASGTKPDHQTWCTRLSGHIYYGNPEEGIQLLYEWGNSWYAEISKMFTEHNVPIPEMAKLHRDGPTIPRPNTVALTTVITALIQRGAGQRRRLDLVPDAFAWAATFGLKPSLWTYNTLFRTCLKDNNLKEAMQILSKMEEDSITPDEYTFYGFADFVFQQAGRSSMSGEEQYRLMFNILDLLEQRGLEPGKVFFGSMINALLKRGAAGDANLPAAEMLLRIMMKKDVPVPSAVWTSFMTYHFQSSREKGTLNIHAIDNLWKKMNETILGLDGQFYDRMIEGYASFGEINRAIMMLERMGKEGKRPSWGALASLLQALVEQNLMEKAGELVRDAATWSGLLKDGVRTYRDTSRNVARERFFEIAGSAGLLAEEVDMRSVREYRVSEGGGMEIPMGVGEGYGRQQDRGEERATFGESEAAGEQLKDLGEIEREFSSGFQMMPGWDDVVERPSTRRRR